MAISNFPEMLDAIKFLVDHLVDELIDFPAIVRTIGNSQSSGFEASGGNTNLHNKSDEGVLNVNNEARKKDENVDGESEMLRIVREILDEQGLDAENVAAVKFAEGSNTTEIVRCAAALDCGLCRLFFGIEENSVIHYLIMPTKIPEAKRIDVVTYFTLINYGLKPGNFEMDLDDGEVRFKIACFLPGSRLSPEMVAGMILIAATIVDKVYPGLMSIIYAGKPPKRAYDDAFGATLASPTP